MSSTQTTGHQRAGHAAAAVVLTPGAIRGVVHSRWRSLRDQLPGEFTADQRVPGRRGLQLCLGLIWLLDAALQFQPFMFRPLFVTSVIEPAAAGNPAFVTRLGRLGKPS